MAPERRTWTRACAHRLISSREPTASSCPNMPEGVGPQEGPKRRRSPATGEHPAQRAVPQQRHVDAVCPGDHARRQRRDPSAGLSHRPAGRSVGARRPGRAGQPAPRAAAPAPSRARHEVESSNSAVKPRHPLIYRVSFVAVDLVPREGRFSSTARASRLDDPRFTPRLLDPGLVLVRLVPGRSGVEDVG